jgi:3-oxoacyl-[acyl-carrier-protein] synthase I
MGAYQKVFITGRSALTASGATATDTWDAILAGRSGIGEITQWDLSSFSARLGGELKDIVPAQLLPDRKLVKVISRQDVMGINAAVQAVQHSNMIQYRDTLESANHFNEQTAVYVGSPGNKYMQQYDFLPLIAKTKGDMQAFAHQLFDEVHPMWLLRILPNNVLAYTGITYGFKGPNHNITNHAVGGAQALIEAFHAIRSGQAARAVVVGYDMGVEPQALYYYDKLGVVSATHLKPFDVSHNGTILGDGAAALVLESEESARARHATCYGEILSAVSNTDGVGLFSLESEGLHLGALMNDALTKAELEPCDVGLIVAHGNGNAKSDISEAAAINHVFSNHHAPVTAFKWSMGHTLCASGLLDAVLTTHCLESACAPGIANLEEQAPSCDGLNLCATHRSIDKQSHAVMINRGFASMNTCLVFKACE